MNLTAIFESWHIGDGNYPPLDKGQLVNLSFELEPRNMEEVSLSVPETFECLGKGEYRCCATVQKVYSSGDRVTLVIMQTGNFRFYIAAKSDRYVQGRRYRGEGTLLLDHFSWVEFLEDYQDPPDLFFNLAVNRILRIRIPERFVARHETGKSLPTRLVPEDYSAADVDELDTMKGLEFDEEFFVIEFDSSGLEGRDIPRTFLS